MALNIFGVTADSVRRHHFPHNDAFSASTSPTDTTVTEAINEEAGKLQGALLKESVTASAIVSGTAPYVQCSWVLRVMVAARIGNSMVGADPELLKTWRGLVKDWLQRLEDDGATFLGDDTLSTGASDPDGPTTHIDEYALDTGDDADASSAAPYLRRDDAL